MKIGKAFRKRAFAAFLLALLLLLGGCAENLRHETTALPQESTDLPPQTESSSAMQTEETTAPPGSDAVTDAAERETSASESTEEESTETTELLPSTTEAEEESDTLQIVSYESAVRRNETVTLSAKGKPNTAYRITVYYKSGPSSAAGLEEKVSDSDGNVSWTWKIGGRTAAGTFRIVVEGGDESVSVSFTVKTE